MPGGRWFGAGGVRDEDPDCSVLPSPHMAGPETRVSPLELASCRSRAVKSLISSGPLNARLRGPDGELDEQYSLHELIYSDDTCDCR